MPIIARPFLPGEWSAHGQYAPRVALTMDAAIGVRHYRVNTHDETKAANAPGLPRYRDQWDSLVYPLLLVESHEFAYCAGTDDPSTQSGGITIVRVNYRWNFDGTPLPGYKVAYDEVFGRAVQRYVRWDVRYVDATSPPDSKRLIDSGKGTTKEEGMSVHRVTVYTSENGPIDMQRLLRLRQKQAVNSDDIRLPQIKGFPGQGRLISANHLRFHDFQIGIERNYRKIVYTLLEGIDMHLFRWVGQDDKGSALARYNSQVYELEPFAGIFSF